MHIFISYPHPDRAALHRLVDWLKAHDIAVSEIWYDDHIEAGDTWREEIDEALDAAYAVLVVVTRHTLRSSYCMYEVGYAFGQGIPIFPLVFETIAITEIPAPLAAKQFMDCTQGIPNTLVQQVRPLQSAPPQARAIDNTVYQAIYATHRRFFILGWLGQAVISLGDFINDDLMDRFVQEASAAHETLQSLLLDRKAAFNGKQYRHCWQLIDLLHEFRELDLRHRINGLPSGVLRLQKHLYPQFGSTWQPAFAYFERDGQWATSVKPHFEQIAVDDRHKMIVMVELLRAFPDLDFYMAEALVVSKIERGG